MPRSSRPALILVTLIAAPAWAGNPPPSPNGIPFPADYAHWRIIATSHRSDNQTLRAILGNAIAQAAVAEGRTKPWPNGAMLAKIVWKDAEHPRWAAATVPGDFVHVEFMLKDEGRFADSGGWGFARWVGEDLRPYGQGPDFSQECFSCHTPMKDNDYVFTHPAPLPSP